MRAKIAVDYRMHKASGIGTILTNLVPRLAKLWPEVEWVLLTEKAGISGPLAELPNVQQVPCESRIFSISEQLEIPKKIPKDVTLFWSPHINVPLFWKGELIVTVCDAFHLAMPDVFKGWHKRLYAKILFRHIRKKARKVMTISDFSKSELMRLANLFSEQLEVIKCGIDRSWKEVVKEERPWAKPYFLYVGNVRPHKNLRRLVEAMTLLKNKVDHDLVIVGKMDGFLSNEESLPETARKNLGDRIHFTGAVDFKKLQQFYAHADALILPSLYEGFGLPPLEAMACGVPTIVSKRASLPEVCGDASLYINPENIEDMAEKMFRMATDAELRKTLVLKGYDRVKIYDWDASTAQTSEVLKNAISQVKESSV